MRRRKWPLKNLESGKALRICAYAYLGVSLALIASFIIIYLSLNPSNNNDPESFWAAVLAHAPLFCGAGYLISLGLIILLAWKCRHCRMGPGKRIATALQKMSQGDLGWRITLRRGDELANVADSVTRASESLADRINKMQIQARQLTEIENYLIDSMDTNRIDPHTLKALRKLKICTNRLNSNMDDFQLSTITSLASVHAPQENQPVEELEQV